MREYDELINEQKNSITLFESQYNQKREALESNLSKLRAELELVRLRTSLTAAVEYLNDTRKTQKSDINDYRTTFVAFRALIIRGKLR